MSRSPRLQMDEEPVEEKDSLTTAKKEPPWWLSWEFYLIMLLAIGLRLYRIDTAQYMNDHNTFYLMAHDAVAHGLFPISGNRASAGSLIPPLFVYIMMIPAAITPNPIAGNILIALCNIVAVALTYLFVRRYYGRVAGTISTLLYATAINVIIFSRDIWQPDLLPLFVISLLFLLFRGVVDGKRYWFLPAVLLLGAMYQFHNTSVYLIAPLFIAIILAFKTIRWRELPLTLLALLLLFAPYIYLESRNHATDLQLLFTTARKPAVFSSDSIEFYRIFLHSFVANPLEYQFTQLNQNFDTHLIPGNGQSILITTPLHYIATLIHPESWLLEILVAIGALVVIGIILWPEHTSERRGLKNWWKELLASPQRKGLIVLLAWQGTVLLMLLHAVQLYIHYEIYLLPGSFILLGLLLSRVIKLGHRLSFTWERVMRYGLYVAVGLIVGIQLVGSIGWLVDHARGNFDSNYAVPEYFDLATMQRIVNDADQVAQQHHLARAYIGIHGDDEGAVTYLAQFAHTQMSVFDPQQCIVLPDLKSGPVVYVADPNREDINTLLNQYTVTRQVKEIQHPGGKPFKLYILSAKPEPQPVLQLSSGLQLLSQQADVLPNSNSTSQWIAMRWKILKTQNPQSRTLYNYRFFSPANTGSSAAQQLCKLSRTWTNDQLMTLFSFSKNAPMQLTLSVQTFLSKPQHYDLGSLKLVTFNTVNTARILLHEKNGQKTITMSVITHGLAKP